MTGGHNTYGIKNLQKEKGIPSLTLTTRARGGQKKEEGGRRDVCGRRWVCGDANIIVCVRVSWKGTQEKSALMLYILYIEHAVGDTNEAAHQVLVTPDDQPTGHL